MHPHHTTEHLIVLWPSDGQGNWTSTGCTTDLDQLEPNGIVICLGDHLANFAVLVVS